MASHDGGGSRVTEIGVPHFVHLHSTSDTAFAPAVGPGSTQDTPLLAPACTDPHARLRRGGGRDTFVLSKLGKSTGRRAPHILALSHVPQRRCRMRIERRDPTLKYPRAVREEKRRLVFDWLLEFQCSSVYLLTRRLGMTTRSSYDFFRSLLMTLPP